MNKSTSVKKSISILGAGKIGLALATLWTKAGHSVCLGSRNPEKLQATNVKNIKAAAAEGDIIVLAVPYSAVESLITEVSDELKNKIIIDATNPFDLSPEGHVISTLGSEITAGTHMATLLPNSIVVRAFTHIMEELLVSRGTKQPGLFALAIAGDDLTAKSIVSELVTDAGFVPIDIGNLAESAPLDPGGILFPHVLTPADMKLVLKKNLARQHMIETFDKHVNAELAGDLETTLATMTNSPHLHNIPTPVGGFGIAGVQAFYKNHLVGKFFPPDVEMINVARIVSDDYIVDEVVVKFTHTIMIDWMLPKVAPTGKRVEVAIAVIVKFSEGKVAHEHIYWDQANVLVQLGLLDAKNLPVTGVESARKVLDPSLLTQS